MAKKARLKNDAFSWVQDTKQPKLETQEAPKAAGPKKMSEEKSQKPAVKKSATSIQVAPTMSPEKPELVRSPSAPAAAVIAGETVEAQSVIFVKFFVVNSTAPNSGQIAAILEYAPGRESMFGDPIQPWSEIPSVQQSFRFPRSGELLELQLDEIHRLYKVDLTPGGFELVLINPNP